jgi:hypothetical protein
MKIAILYTGELRTIKKTIDYFIKNVLNLYDCSIFASIQGSSYGQKLDENEYSNFLKDKLGERLKTLKWIDKENGEYINISNNILNNFNFYNLDHRGLNYLKQKIDYNRVKETENIKNYLKSSGTLIEHFQIYQSYLSMIEFENVNNLKFDYVMRFRTDTILFKKLNLDIFNFSKESFNKKLSLYQSKNILDTTNRIINSYIFPDFINQNKKIIKNEIRNIFEYLKNEKFVFVIRANLIYITKRDNMAIISNIINEYAKKGHELEPSHYWNAENQFRSICLRNGIDMFNFENESGQECFYNFDKDSFVDDKTIYGIIRS